ncbi:hypothetical protein PMAYCL1PPCAC_00720 [Pristionchus mayeri]|uniref:Uncharacterized protein n=1 Tax=Pristionchus mayeri TaxID=1317129 RepID=A0AAN4Z4H1_9BILA|nr:hypothetical protein PMAYCL1PPCAC_00720 [Pristionchus mayeri]
MSGAEAPPPPPPQGGYQPHGAGSQWNPWQGEWHHYSKGPNGHHYYNYVHHYKRCGGRWGTGFVVGGLVGIWAASCWNRPDAAAGDCAWGYYRGPWCAQKREGQAPEKKPEDITNQ